MERKYTRKSSKSNQGIKPPIFIDSGAHGLYTEHVLKHNPNFWQSFWEQGPHPTVYKWYKTDEFTDYLDSYAAFIKQYDDVIDIYANVDVIFNPKLTWDAQRYLEEEHGLSPRPVIHYGTPLKWLEKYLGAGYDYICLGGLGQGLGSDVYVRWADQAFGVICDPSTYLPTAKVHGFAMTSHKLMVRYPWYSVDSTSWILYAAYGGVLCPPRRNGRWVYDEKPYVIKVTPNPIKGGKEIDLYSTHKHHLKKIAMDYIGEKGFVLGQSTYDADQKEDTVVEEGLCNAYRLRVELNALYFVDLVQYLPQWPWPFKPSKKIERLL